MLQSVETRDHHGTLSDCATFRDLFYRGRVSDADPSDAEGNTPCTKSYPRAFDLHWIACQVGLKGLQNLRPLQNRGDKILVRNWSISLRFHYPQKSFLPLAALRSTNRAPKTNQQDSRDHIPPKFNSSSSERESHLPPCRGKTQGKSSDHHRGENPPKQN